MRVLYQTYPMAFNCPGGGEVQLLKSKQAAEQAGVEVLLFDQWKPQLREVDAVHFFSSQGGSLPFCSQVKQLGLPLLVSPVLWLTNGNAQNYPLHEIGGLLHLADRILPNSRAELQQLAEHFRLETNRFTVTYNGVDPTFARGADPGVFRSRFQLDGPFLLNVANVEPRKNQVRMAQAVRDLGLDLVILGRVRDRTYLEACLQEGRGAVKYLGYVEQDGELLRSAYAGCEVFLLPSLLETPGLAALEAAAVGAKLVVTEVGSTREYFGDMAAYVDPADVKDIRENVQQQLDAPADTRLQEHIVANFAWRRTGESLKEAYASVVA